MSEPPPPPPAGDAEALARFQAEARRRQSAYHRSRLAWARSIGLPCREDPEELTPPPGRLLLKDEEEG